MKVPQLIDTFGRRHDYLRISLTDKCNFRCTYCMPDENMSFLPSKRLMAANEIIQLSSIFVDMGISKIRLTGGEPTLRRDLSDIVCGLSALPVELSITTNGWRLPQHVKHFKAAGMKSLNISLDTMRADRFLSITRRDKLPQVLAGIKAAVEEGFKVKVNAVIMRGINDDELPEMLSWASFTGVEVRFIEYMPFFGNHWEYQKVVRQAEMLDSVRREWTLKEMKSPVDSTATRYYIAELNCVFGIISTISNPFCNGCSRIRLTADGKIKNCLFSSDETDLLHVFRNGGDVRELITGVIFRKKLMAAGKIDFSAEQARTEYAKNRAMVSIGG